MNVTLIACLFYSITRSIGLMTVQNPNEGEGAAALQQPFMQITKDYIYICSVLQRCSKFDNIYFLNQRVFSPQTVYVLLFSHYLNCCAMTMFFTCKESLNVYVISHRMERI